MSDFEDFCETAADDACGVFGLTEAVILDITVQGVLDVVALDRSLAVGGERASTACNFHIAPTEAALLAALGDPLERALDNQKMTIGDREYRILKVMTDAAGIHLYLEDSQR